MSSCCCPTGRLSQGTLSEARRGRVSAVPQEASEARSAGHGAQASGIPSGASRRRRLDAQHKSPARQGDAPQRSRSGTPRRAGPALAGYPRGRQAQRGGGGRQPSPRRQAKRAAPATARRRQGRDATVGSMRSTKARPARATPLNDQDLERLAGQGLPWPAPPGGAKRSVGHGAKASGIEARQGLDAAGGSMRSTKARPARETLLNEDGVASEFGKNRTLGRP